MPDAMIRRVMLILALLAVFSGAVLGWDGHDLITYHSLKDFATLDIPLVETEYTYGERDTTEYNPSFVVKFLHEDWDELTAFQVLVDYAQEPDWDLDTGLELNPLQMLTGGSQGWRHQRYTLLGGLIALGVAPERAQHFYDLAVYAYEQGDLYWAFRFLSRSLHYLQDMGQPYHSLPMPVAHFLTKHRLNLTNATIVGENVHYNLEWYVEWRLTQEYEPFIDVLTRTDYVEFATVEEAALDLNNEVRRIVERQYDLTLAVWPDLGIPVKQTLDFERDPVPTGKFLTELHEIIEQTLGRTGEYTRGLIWRFKQDVGL